MIRLPIRTAPAAFTSGPPNIAPVDDDAGRADARVLGRRPPRRSRLGLRGRPAAGRRTALAERAHRRPVPAPRQPAPGERPCADTLTPRSAPTSSVRDVPSGPPPPSGRGAAAPGVVVAAVGGLAGGALVGGARCRRRAGPSPASEARRRLGRAWRRRSGREAHRSRGSTCWRRTAGCQDGSGPRHPGRDRVSAQGRVEGPARVPTARTRPDDNLGHEPCPPPRSGAC